MTKAKRSHTDNCVPNFRPSQGSVPNWEFENTLYSWQKRHPDFEDACARAVLISESLVQDRANNGLYNAQFAAFFGKNAFGWKDKTEVETVSSQDTIEAGAFRQALAAATPEELQAITAIFDKLIARGKAAEVESAAQK